MTNSPPSYPSRPKMLQGLFSEAYKTAKQGLCGDRVLASKSNVEKRLAICSTCEKYNAEATRCTVCGCFMLVKANIEVSECPDGKW
ncbi:DUF6171 family protein [Rivularia sp. UHCC 0363]|uniref:DUF6171 family protein n=1 Tax=Rivularia sp. UHCC 0363 TaxID=3110244 RepID=UPI002B1F07E5|nr:DUF6171 family protein [Rivularia sp. UHCC 0363]MEA5597216.1 DUF6171 family protein [Rivularia sp. UHCC 0363]